VRAPRRGAAVLGDAVYREVGHEARRRFAVPVPLARLEKHPIAGADDLDRSTAALHQADALSDVDNLAVGVGVPGRAGRSDRVAAKVVSMRSAAISRLTCRP
jgi:hypothetical protein